MVFVVLILVIVSFVALIAGRLAPPRGKSGCPAPPRKKQALPRPAEIDKTRGAQRGKADYRLHRLCPHIWAESGEMKEKLFIWSFVQLVIIWFAGRPLKVRECNVFLDQNTIL